MEVPTEAGPADIATNAVDQATILEHLEDCGAAVSKRAAYNNHVFFFSGAGPLSPPVHQQQLVYNHVYRDWLWAATLSTCHRRR